MKYVIGICLIVLSTLWVCNLAVTLQRGGSIMWLATLIIPVACWLRLMLK